MRGLGSPWPETCIPSLLSVAPRGLSQRWSAGRGWRSRSEGAWFLDHEGPASRGGPCSPLRYSCWCPARGSAQLVLSDDRCDTLRVVLGLRTRPFQLLVTGAEAPGSVCCSGVHTVGICVYPRSGWRRGFSPNGGHCRVDRGPPTWTCALLGMRAHAFLAPTASPPPGLSPSYRPAAGGLATLGTSPVNAGPWTRARAPLDASVPHAPQLGQPELSPAPA